MPVEQLASKTDVEAALGRTLTPEETAKVGSILDKASELFRIRSGQQFTFGDSLVRLKVNGGSVRLPQRPVVSVSSVTDDDDTGVPFDLFGSVLTVPRTSDRFVRVQYKHGGDVPEVVRLCIAEVAKKVLSIDPKAASGLTQFGRTLGPFSRQYTYATWAQGGQTMLAPDDAVLADSFKIRLGQTIVMRP